MANYGEIRNLKPALDKESFLGHVRAAVLDLLGPKWNVAWADFDHDGPTLWVSIPGTSGTVDAYWGKLNDGNPPEDVGFVVSLYDRHTIMFRHGPTMEFTNWARGCIEEELSERLKAPLHYDAGPTTYQPGHREYRRGKTLREYLLRNFKGKDREEWGSGDFIQRLLRGTPPGFE